jgi:hypothetical protein
MFDRMMYKILGGMDMFFLRIEKFFTKKSKNENKRKH